MKRRQTSFRAFPTIGRAFLSFRWSAMEQPTSVDVAGLQCAKAHRNHTTTVEMSLIEEVQQHLGPAEIQQISQQLGIEPQAAQTAVESALPMMVAGMAGTAQQPAGEEQIRSLFGAHGGTLGNLAAAITGAAGGTGGGGGLLGTILGGHHKTVEDGVGQTTGLQPDQSKRLLMILAPIVLAVLARRHASANNNTGSIGGALQQDAQAAQQNGAPHMGGILGKILSHVQAPNS